MRLIVLNQKNSRLKIKKLIFDWNKMVTYPNFKRDYKGPRKSSLFFLTSANSTEMNQSETVPVYITINLRYSLVTSTPFRFPTRYNLFITTVEYQCKKL